MTNDICATRKKLGRAATGAHPGTGVIDTPPTSGATLPEPVRTPQEVPRRHVSLMPQTPGTEEVPS